MRPLHATKTYMPSPIWHFLLHKSSLVRLCRRNPLHDFVLKTKQIITQFVLKMSSYIISVFERNKPNILVQWARLINIRSRVTKWYTLELAIITESNAINFAWRVGRKHTISTYYSAPVGRIYSKLRMNCAGANFISLYTAGINRGIENAIKKLLYLRLSSSFPSICKLKAAISRGRG